MDIAPTPTPAGEAAPAPVTPPADDIQNRINQSLDIISKRERENARREHEWKTKERDFTAALDKAKAHDSFVERIKADPLSVLEELGIELSSLNERALSAPIDPAVRGLRSELQKVQDRLKERDEVEARQRNESADREFRATLDSFLKDKEEYELINAQGASELVYQVVAQHWQKTFDETGTGEVMDFAKAAELVEKHLEVEAEKLARTKKISARFQTPSEPKPTSSPANSDRATLTNGMRSVTEPSSNSERVSDAELNRRAIAVLTQSMR
jgi:hypothetical protein